MFGDASQTTFRDSSSEKLTRDVDIFYEKYDHERPPVPTWTYTATETATATATETVTITQTLSKMVFGFEKYTDSGSKGQIRMRLLVPEKDDGINAVAFESSELTVLEVYPDTMIYAPEKFPGTKFAFINTIELREIYIVFSYDTNPILPSDKDKIIISRSDTGYVDNTEYDYETLLTSDVPFYVPKVVAPSWTPSQTMTLSATPTQTVTPTPTQTKTMTQTVTQTQTQTMTQTQTQTVTITHPSPTPTMSRTHTVTITHPTPTPSETVTITHPSPTPTVTTTNTVTITHPTPTPTVTETDTPAVTPSMSPTMTVTPSAAPTPTMTTTNTVTATSTLSETPTPTVTATSTETVTATSTLSETPTPTVTATSTETVTATITLSDTPTPTVTMTSTETVTATITLSETPTPTVTMTPTPTVTATSTSTETTTPSMTITGSPDKASSHLYFEESTADGVTTVDVYFNAWYGVESSDGIFIGKKYDGDDTVTEGVKEFRTSFNNFQFSSDSDLTKPHTDYFNYVSLGSSPHTGLSINTRTEYYHDLHNVGGVINKNSIRLVSIKGTKTGEISFKTGPAFTSVTARAIVGGYMGFDYVVKNGITVYEHDVDIDKSNADNTDVISTGRKFKIQSLS